MTSFFVGALDADVPGASCGRLSEQGNITAQVKNHVGGTGRLQILRECRADPPLSDSPEINALTFADAHAADVVLALRFNLRVVNLFERRINIASRRNLIAAETDLPDVDKSADRGLERPVGSLCYGLGFFRQFSDAAVDLNPFARAFIDLVERPLAVHRKKRFVVIDAF